MAKTSPKPFCLVLMPFDIAFDDIYELGIKAACKAAGAYCERIDEQHFHETMLDRIYNQIAKADFLVADMTGRNANVFYEVGYAHALNKRTILLTQEAGDIPFDLKHYQHIVYGGSITTLRDSLRAKLEWCIDTPIEIDPKGTIEIEIHRGSEKLSSGDMCLKSGHLWLAVHNSSGRTLEADSFRIGIITDTDVHCGRPSLTEQFEEVRLPDGRDMAMLPAFDKIFPGQSVPFVIILGSNATTDRSIVFRIFTDAGVRDFTAILKLDSTKK